MKEQVQDIGIRPWFGDDIISIQNEVFDALQAHFASIGTAYVLQGCAVTNKDIAPGLVFLEGKIRRFAGATDVRSLPVYMIAKDEETDLRNYETGGAKPCAKVYGVSLTEERPLVGEFIKIDARGARGYFEAIQNARRRFVTDSEQATWNSKAPQSIVDKIQLEKVDKHSNLADLPDKIVARRNLELGTAALKNTGTASGELITADQTERMLNERLQCIEGAFMHTFEVGGDVDRYYPVVFQIYREAAYRKSPRMPLVYDIYRVGYEKAPEVLNTAKEPKQRYMGLSLRILCTSGIWDEGANLCKVLYHNYVYNKGVAKVQMFDQLVSRLFVWLRGGGVRYHIRSPIDLSQGITILLGDATKFSSSVVVIPIAVGREDPNLVRTGSYTGWVYGLQHDDIKSLDDRVNNLENLPARVSNLENLPGRVGNLENLPARVGHLETLIGRLERLERIVAPFDGISQRFTGTISADVNNKLYYRVEIYVTNGVVTGINTVKRETQNYYGGATMFTG